MKERLFDKNQIRILAKKYNLDSPKDWGQHFLVDSGPVRKMISSAKIKENDVVTEIGPGFGTLTFPLAENSEQVLAFEIEKRLEPYWEQNNKDNIEVIWGDGLVNFKNYQSRLPSKYKFVSNLPYQISAKVFREVLGAENKPSNMTVMIQKEVAEKICSKDDKNKLSVMVGLYGEPELVGYVSSGSFYPEPEVDSAILTINNITTPDINEEAFFELLTAGFSHRRKQLKNNLASELDIKKDTAANILEDITGNGKIRAQKLSVSQWVKLLHQFK
ncbi:MAG: 16S rRNA (adenine(1518)-N(6)/adenine(1519)-N(6))-dimethyltransferase RsmA [Candidatus Magasanikbacteria bacterium]